MPKAKNTTAKLRPALTPEAREKQLIALANEAAENSYERERHRHK